MSKAPDFVDRYVGRRIRVRRLALGMSQEKLASSLGLTFQQVQKYEMGTNRVGAGRLFLISRTLDVSIGYFFDGLSYVDPESGESSLVCDLACGMSEDSSDASFVMDFFSSTDGITVSKSFFKLDVRKRRLVMDLINSLLDKSDDTSV